ncbi:putative ribonuclease H-like domain-containing protein [Tanacetum coccineum]|uniref:Ribonuclease H-like domain-containing protein n=1 Tax=Tanacetum coccineum TaxID=301880 RepID=A0ABQ5BJ47_9ASTR
MNYHPVSAGNRANVNAGIETNSDAGQAEKEKVPDQEYILLPLLHTSSYGPSTSEEAVSSPHDDVAGKKIDQEPANEEDHTLKDDVDDMLHQEKMATKHPDDARSQFEEECDAQLCKGMRTRTSSTNSFNTVRTPLNTASASRTSYPAGTSSEPQLMPIDGSFSIDINDYPDDPLMPELEDTAEIHSTGIFGSAYDDSPNTPIDDQSVGAEADFNNMEPSINVSPIPTTRIHSIHPKDQIIGDPKSAVQTRRMAKKSEAGLVSFINKQRRTNHKDFQNCLFACFLSQVEPKKVNQALDDVSWVEAMQEELLQFKLLNVWTLVDLPKGKKAIGTKWVFRNKKDQRGIVVRNKARLVAQGHRQEEGIDYDEVFAPVARIEAIRLFLAYASYMDFTVYQMDVKSAFLYGTIEEEVYVNQPPGFEDPEFPNKVYKVEKALYGLHQAPRAWYETLSTYLLENGFRREQRKDGIFLSQDKYVYDILKKFGFTTVKTASTPMETHKSLSSNTAKPDVDVYLYRSVISTLMYLTSSRPDIMFVGKPTLGLWYPKDSPMDLIAYSDSDYAGASIDRKSTIGGCQFLGSRLVSWQCKKQTIVANSTTEAEYIAASHCCGQVLWLQNQLLDYGYNFMRTKIHIDNERTISVIKNPVSHSKTKHIVIRFHFIRDSYEKKLIEIVKIHTDNNVANLLTKAFDVTSTTEEGLQAISATIDGYEKLITEASLRRHLKLEDAEGISSLSNEEIFEQLAHMGYVTNSKSLTFFKGHFSPQWKFFIDTILHCLSSKKTAWDQFSSNIVITIIYLAITSRFNFTKFIFEAMVKNLDSPHKFLLYPRFIQLLLNKQQSLVLPHTRTYPTPTLTSKLFSNMRRASKGYSGVVTPLFEKETASMPYDSPLHAVHSHGSAEGSMQQHDLTVLVNKLNDRINGLEKDLHQTKKTYSTALTKLVLRVKKLEYKLKSGKARRKAKIVLSDDEEIAEDSSKQGRKISQINEDPTISLVQDKETPTKIIEEHGSGEKGEMEISTASPLKVTKVSTAEAHVYTRRSAKDKGKAIIEESATPNKNDPSVLRYHALKNKPVLIAQARRNIITYLKNQGGYKESYFKRMSYNDIRLIFERVWTCPYYIPYRLFEVEKGSSKPSKRETSNKVEEEKVEKEDVKPDSVMIEKKAVRTRRKTLARRRASDKQVKDSSKRQKKEKETDDFEQEKEDLRIWLSVLKDEEESVTPEFLSVRYPIVNWEYQIYGRIEMKDMEAYKLTRADVTVSFHGGTESLFRRLDRDDLKVLYKLVQERFEDHSLEEKELILRGDLRMMFDPDEIWKNQENGPHNESDEKDKSEDDSSPKEVNAAGQHVNTASPEVNTSRFKLNTVDPLVNTASYYELYSPKDMFKLGASHTLETTHVEFFSDEDEPEVDLESITNSYTVLTTPNTRIHKDHLIKNVIGDVKSSIQTRRMTKSTSEQGFLSAVYE